MNRRFIKTMAFLAAAMTAASASLVLKQSPLTGVPMTVYADDEAEFTEGVYGDLTYLKYSDHIEITGGKGENGQVPLMSASTITIPSTIDGLPVTRIYENSFCSYAVQTLKLPDTLEEIGQYAFSWCTNLDNVTLPASMKRIDFQAFEQCSSLKSLTFPDSLVETSGNTFEGTPWLEAQRKANPLVIINGALIDGRTCKGDVTVPDGVKYVAGGAFAGNTDLTSIKMPKSVVTIEDDVFSDCTNLTSAELKGVTDLGYCVFGACDKLKDLKLSGNLKSINSGAFAENNGTATITFYGTKETWDAVEKDPEDPYLTRATMIFDPNGGDEPEEVIGDLNADGKCDKKDVELLHDWLLAAPNVMLADWEAGDMDGNGKLNGADLSLLKLYLLA